ncbi:glycerol kinase GlpK [Pontiella sulfatireligans]|uniref:Glycerol kinase n=1 Tax=Pontiella sulfatireligans TaxID=2750658 RepID=A0A6C2UF19_9BACT|nr:glycerol kinase GlpK [Pontiella sulfatireligans]VGO17964.1 Glycerol kinase [Pontiella sulfatireligans]
MKCVFALDQGTTSSRSILFDRAGKVRAAAQRELKQIYPQPGWVEHDPIAIWEAQQSTAHKAMHQAGVHSEDIVAIGITNQRETTVVWNRKTGKPIHNAIVWQDRRTADLCARLKADGAETLFYEKTGLLLDPYFSGTKIKWLLDHIDGARAKAERGELAFGTMDSWLVWNLTRGRHHITDVSNASRTLLFNIHTLEWDKELLELLKIPRSMMPDVHSSSEAYGSVDKLLCECGCTIAGIVGDQQAALFGQACFEPGDAKNTYGTGCFLLKNTGAEAVASNNKLLTTIAWKRGDEINYALEGSVFIGGAVVQWLRDELGIIKSSSDIQQLAAQVPDSGGVYFVPAFAGLGAPHWDPNARGAIIGLTRGSGKAHLARAAQEAICFQSMELIQAMEKVSGAPMDLLRVDGGACADDLLMQIQANLLQVPVERPKLIETTAFGAAALAGLAVGFWQNLDEIAAHREIDRIFEPQITSDEAGARYALWMKAVERSKAWA